jgi:uncharacterized SAM-binding protein YcdF (DUF218 family)
MRRADALRVALEALAAVFIIVLVDVTISGYLLFNNARVDDLQHADAVVVLGGEHDGREDYGLELAVDGWAPTVVLSDPYPQGDEVMEKACRRREDIEVICVRPSVLTTRGEAMAVRTLANERSWDKIIVVTWRYHLPRARLVFRQCFSDSPDVAVMRPVPREYPFSLLQWDAVYIYQFAGYAKAILQGDCS